jgi:phage tail sheath protein FI
MAVRPTYPGVYIEEIPSAVRTIAGVSTSTALFIGRATRGPMDSPTRCLSFAEFERTFGTDARYGELPFSVRMFFENGGSECWIVRIARTARAASVTLKSEAGTEVLKLTAREKGAIGDFIRVAVTYAGATPEATFNLELHRWEKLAGGDLVRREVEQLTNLTMRPGAPRNVVDMVAQGSRLVDASVVPGLAAAATGYSQSGLPLVSNSAANFRSDWNAIVGGANQFVLDVDDSGPVPIDLAAAGPAAGTIAQWATALTNTIAPQLPPGKSVTVAFVPGPGGQNETRMLRISCATGDVRIYPAADSGKNLASKLMLGTPYGGIEASKWANLRPAPTGAVFKALPAQTDADDLATLNGFGDTAQNAITSITLSGPTVVAKMVALSLGTTTDSIYLDAAGGRDGVRQRLAQIASALNAAATADPELRFRAELWGSRLALLPVDPLGDAFAPTLATGATNVGASFLANVRYYSLGTSGTGTCQTPGDAGSDGFAPTASEYAAAYLAIDRAVDLFNLLVLPRDDSGLDRTTLWGAASAYCAKRRAFLLVDPPDGWKTRDDAVDASSGVNKLRQGVVKDSSAVFFPRVLFNDNGRAVPVSPGGAIAGLMARIDSSRGVWKAPAGTEASLLGVLGLERQFSNDENGVMNPRAVNTLRVFPSGIVNWGARTLDGDDDFGSQWKYVPVRRLALYLEESLYRGTQWVVFEPNDEPLWSQIRLNVGAFLHSLFRQGAFQGTTQREAYFVKCDRDTTTQDDVNRGMVNIVVGFAPLKPAEFVIVKIQQLTGQLAA